VVYNYSLFAFFYVDDTFFNKATGPNFGENICVSVFQCFLTILSLVRLADCRSRGPLAAWAM
jgi:hypothetical protein